MNGLTTWIALGFGHIVDIGAMDHLLFLVALIAPYRLVDWRRLLVVATAFTAGHSITLALTVMGRPILPAAVIEFLIPVTIFLAAASNLRRGQLPQTSRTAAVAGCFGLVHGAGFANYLTSLFEASVALPLFGFNLGIELGQLTIIVAGLAGFTLLDRIITPRSRMMLASAAAGIWALVVAVERAPW